MVGCCNIWEVFEEDKNLIKEYKYWKWLVRNRNTTLGNCVIITKQHHEALSELSDREMSELSQIVKDVEMSIKSAFSCDKFNYLMLMMKDKHTHFHVLPRYSSSREFASQTWLDDDWPKSSHKIKELVSQEILDKIKNEIKNNLIT